MARLGSGDKVLVLTSDWGQATTFIRWFPDQPCVDLSSGAKITRARLINATNAGTAGDCKYGGSFPMTRCTVQ